MTAGVADFNVQACAQANEEDRSRMPGRIPGDLNGLSANEAGCVPGQCGVPGDSENPGNGYHAQPCGDSNKEARIFRLYRVSWFQSSMCRARLLQRLKFAGAARWRRHCSSGNGLGADVWLGPSRVWSSAEAVLRRAARIGLLCAAVQPVAYEQRRISTCRAEPAIRYDVWQPKGALHPPANVWRSHAANNAHPRACEFRRGCLNRKRPASLWAFLHWARQR